VTREGAKNAWGVLDDRGVGEIGTDPGRKIKINVIKIKNYWIFKKKQNRGTLPFQSHTEKNEKRSSALLVYYKKKVEATQKKKKLFGEESKPGKKTHEEKMTRRELVVAKSRGQLWPNRGRSGPQKRRRSTRSQVKRGTQEEGWRRGKIRLVGREHGVKGRGSKKSEQESSKEEG